MSRNPELIRITDSVRTNNALTYFSSSQSGFVTSCREWLADLIFRLRHPRDARAIRRRLAGLRG